MAKQFFKNTTISYFNNLIQNADNDTPITAKTARLIPPCGSKQEYSLSTVFLSSLRLIKEFRENIFKTLGIKSKGKIYCYTDIIFKNEAIQKNQKYADQKQICQIFDGLVICTHGDSIKETIAFEMKQGNNTLDSQQIDDYLNIAEKYGIDCFVTISNEFVLDPKYTPLTALKCRKPIRDNLKHLSWKLIQSVACILLYDQERIEDEDQRELMHEVVKYMEHPKSGVSGFTQMKKGWSAAKQPEKQ